MATNGYDFNNNANGDTYVWLLGDTLDAWNGARQEFVTLVRALTLLHNGPPVANLLENTDWGCTGPRNGGGRRMPHHCPLDVCKLASIYC